MWATMNNQGNAFACKYVHKRYEKKILDHLLLIISHKAKKLENLIKLKNNLKTRKNHSDHADDKDEICRMHRTLTKCRL